MEVVTELKGHNHWVRALVVSESRLYSGSYNMIKVPSICNLLFATFFPNKTQRLKPPFKIDLGLGHL